MNTYKFPENFKWGSATSAHQIEGDNHNDWSEWEMSKLRVESLKLKGLDPNDFISGRACDSYNRYQEDFDIVKKLNQNIYRFSIEWSRIEPEEGRFDEKEMQHYINVVKALKDRGIEPMITLWHFTNPIWFAKKQGFLNPNSPKYFTRYVKYVAEHLTDVGLWITFNEATTVYSGFSYLKGLWPPQHKNIFEWRRVNKNIIKSHISAYEEIRNIYSPVRSNKEVQLSDLKGTELRVPQPMSHNVMIGIVEHGSYFNTNLVLRFLGAERIFNYFYNNYFSRKALPHYDFIGLNYYTHRRFIKKIDSKVTVERDMGWEFYPEGIYHRLLDLKRFNKPIFITENGWPFVNDDFQLKVIKDNLFWINKAIQDGVDVRGYLYWSLLDNFEWAHGYKPKFGLVEVDFSTFERHIRPSAWEYAKICLTNQLEID
jgi:beta-glucosidase